MQCQLQSGLSEGRSLNPTKQQFHTDQSCFYNYIEMGLEIRDKSYSPNNCFSIELCSHLQTSPTCLVM